MRILIADNELFFVQNLTKYLQKELAVMVDWTLSAAEALEKIKDSDFDVIISDLDLSDANDGSWLLKIARQRPQQAFIIMSARELPLNIKQNKQIHIAAYFEKPFDLKELKNKIMAIMQVQ